MAESFAAGIGPRTLEPDGPVLALDSGSPTVSVALGRAGEVWGLRSVAQASSSEALLRLVAELLAEQGLGPRDLGGIVGARGPGSFTGLRVGLATILGLHQALGVPVAALPTLEVLATAARPEGPERVVAAVDALRGEWHLQPFAAGSPPLAEAPARCLPAAALAALAPCRVVGFGVEALAGAGIVTTEPGPLAPALLRLVHLAPVGWELAALLNPLYLRAPAVTPPKERGASA